jgi:hypothetical protein
MTMPLFCWMDGPNLTLRNDGTRAFDLGRGAHIAIEVTGDAASARCDGFTTSVEGSRVILTSSRRQRWWYPRALLVVELPPGARATSVEFENAVCEVAPEPPAEKRSTGSVIINTFTSDQMLFENITAPVTVYLSWSTTYASKVTLSSVGIVNNSQTMLPMTIQETTTFVLTAYDSALDQMDSKNVTVVIDPPLVTRLVPPGTIAIWSGSEDDKPDGWFICNGDNGTPDLTDRFVMGAGGSEPAGEFGEEQTHTHDMPSWSISPTTSEEPSHTHKFPEPWYGRDFQDGGYSGIDTNGDYSGNETTQGAGAHSHLVPITFPEIETGTNRSPVRPRWYALLYIMKGR